VTKFLSEKLERLESGNLNRRRRISLLAWTHAIQVLTERIQEVDQLAAEAAASTEAARTREEQRASQQERSIAIQLRAKLVDASGRIQDLTDRLKEVGKGPERNSLADPFIRQVQAARAAEREADQRWRSVIACQQ
jgi:hypothetical protein